MVIERKHLVNYEICVYYVIHPCQIYIGTEDRDQFIEPRHKQLCTNVHVQKLLCTGYNQTCPLFTSDAKLISHDGYHLTE